MTDGKVLALVLAGGAGGRMEVLTDERAKPALPFAGTYRLIDVPLSNLSHSGMTDVWLIVQYETQSIVREVANGRPWDLDRTHGGLRVVPPQQDGQRRRHSGGGDDPDDGGAHEDDGWHDGNADAIHANRHLIREHDPDLLLVLSADHVYRLDYREVIDRHRSTEATVTVVTVEVPRAQAPHHATVTVDSDGRVTDFEYKADDPRSTLALTEVFVYDAAAVLDALEALADEAEARGDSGLGDFGHELLPHLVADGAVQEYRLPGYWRDVGRPETYFRAHMEVLAAPPGGHLALDDPTWPVLTREVRRLPARVHGTARLDEAMISPGCDVTGRVERSVLSPGVVVERGAVVTDAVLLHDVVVRAGATVRFAVVDEGAVIGRDATVGDPPRGRWPTTEELALVGRAAKVNRGARVRGGDRVAPGAHVRR